MEKELNPICASNTIVDPPSGWLHGFPALLRENYRKQLLDSGYHAGELDFLVRHSRYWNA